MKVFLQSVVKIKMLLMGLVLALTGAASQAKEVINLAWPWGLGDADSAFTRTMIEKLNQTQNQFTFVFDHRPGAGSTVAANHVLAGPNRIMSASTAFFVRPNFYPTESHDLSQFRPMITMCGTPMIVVSGKYKSWREVPTDRDVTLSVGGMGTTGHLVAAALQSRYPNIRFVLYNGTAQSTIDAVAGTIDLHIAFINGVENWMDQGKLHGLGVTGPRSARNIPTLASQGFSNVERIVNTHSWLAPKSMPEAQFQNIKKLAASMVKNPEIQGVFSNLYCTPSGLADQAANEWFADQVKLWADLSKRAQAAAK